MLWPGVAHLWRVEQETIVITVKMQALVDKDVTFGGFVRFFGSGDDGREFFERHATVRTIQEGGGTIAIPLVHMKGQVQAKHVAHILLQPLFHPFLGKK